MGLLMSDMLLIDPMREHDVWLHDDLSDYVYASDLGCESYEDEAVSRSDDPGAWSILVRWPQRLMTSR
jgi:hypothetical protein